MSRTTSLVLASESPRRADLLRAAGFEFQVVPPLVDERPRAGELPRELVQRLAAEKSAVVARVHASSVVLGADTVVISQGETLGKPVDAVDATRMLGLLSGRTHEVITAVSVRHEACHATSVASASVRFLSLNAWEIAWYVASGESAGKSGAYAIQGLASRFVDRIEGSYGAIVGLPVAAVYRLLCELEVDVGW